MGTFLLRSERPIAARPPSGTSEAIAVHVDANAADDKRFAFVIARGFDQNAAEFAPSRDEVVGPFEADLVSKTLRLECLEHR